MHHKKSPHLEILKKKRKEEGKKKVYLFGGFFFLVVVAFLVFANLENLKIKEIEVTGLKYGQPETISNFIKQEISGQYLFVISKANKYLLSKKAISKKIARTFDFVVSTKMKIEGNKLIVEMTEKIPAAVWCESHEVKAKCFLLTSDGYLISEEPDLFDPETVRFFGKLEKDLEKGLRYAQPESFRKLLYYAEEVEKLDVRPRTIETEDQETYKIQSVGGTKILVNIKDSPQEVVENLKTLFKNESIGEVQLRHIDYIDMRFGNKVYYKPK